MTYLSSRKWTSAKSTKYAGRMFDSKFEASCAFDLDMRLASGELVSWEAQKTLDLVVNGYKVGTYRIDFVAERKDGVTEYIEAKGWSTPIWKLKWAIFEAMMKDEQNVELKVIWQGKQSRLRKVRKV